MQRVGWSLTHDTPASKAARYHAIILPANQENARGNTGTYFSYRQSCRASEVRWRARRGADASCSTIKYQF